MVEDRVLTTIYVEEIMTKPDTSHMRLKRPIHMAVELTIADAKQLSEYLQERIAAGDTGAIRFYVSGILAHV
jgi:recombinational DNA repair protein RecR